MDPGKYVLFLFFSSSFPKKKKKKKKKGGTGSRIKISLAFFFSNSLDLPNGGVTVLRSLWIFQCLSRSHISFMSPTIVDFLGFVPDDGHD